MYILPFLVHYFSDPFRISYCELMTDCQMFALLNARDLSKYRLPIHAYLR